MKGKENREAGFSKEKRGMGFTKKVLWEEGKELFHSGLQTGICRIKITERTKGGHPYRFATRVNIMSITSMQEILKQIRNQIPREEEEKGTTVTVRLGNVDLTPELAQGLAFEVAVSGAKSERDYAASLIRKAAKRGCKKCEEAGISLEDSKDEKESPREDEKADPEEEIRGHGEPRENISETFEKEGEKNAENPSGNEQNEGEGESKKRFGMF